MDMKNSVCFLKMFSNTSLAFDATQSWSPSIPSFLFAGFKEDFAIRLCHEDCANFYSFTTFFMQQCCYSFLWRSFGDPFDLQRCALLISWTSLSARNQIETTTSVMNIVNCINPLKKICAWMCRIKQVSRNEMVSQDAIFFCSVTRIFSQIVSSHGIRKNFLGKQPTRTYNLQQTILLDKCNKT